PAGQAVPSVTSGSRPVGCGGDPSAATSRSSRRSDGAVVRHRDRRAPGGFVAGGSKQRARHSRHRERSSAFPAVLFLAHGWSERLYAPFMEYRTLAMILIALACNGQRVDELEARITALESRLNASPVQPPQGSGIAPAVRA